MSTRIRARVDGLSDAALTTVLSLVLPQGTAEGVGFDAKSLKSFTPYRQKLMHGLLSLSRLIEGAILIDGAASQID